MAIQESIVSRAWSVRHVLGAHDAQYHQSPGEVQQQPHADRRFKLSVPILQEISATLNNGRTDGAAGNDGQKRRPG